MKPWFVRHFDTHRLWQALMAGSMSVALASLPVGPVLAAADPNCLPLLKQFPGLTKSSTGVVPDLVAPPANCLDLRGATGAARLTELKSAPSGKLVVVDQQTLRDPALVDSLAKSRAHLCFATPRNVGAVQALLAAEVRGPKFFALLPSQPEEIRAVWNLPPNQDVSLIARQMSKARPEWEKVANATILGGQPKKTESMAEALRKAIPRREEGSNLVVVFGHNEDGVLRCPDGSTIAVREIQELAEKRQSTAIVLSCDTINVVPDGHGILTTKRLQFDETAKVIQMAQSRLAGQPSHSMGAFLSEIEGAFAGTSTTEARQYRFKLGIGVSGTILTVVVVAIASGDDDDEKTAAARTAVTNP